MAPHTSTSAQPAPHIFKHTKKEVLLLKKVFQSTDLNANLLVEPEEWLRSELHSRVNAAIDIKMSMFNAIDKNGDGVITFEEYLKANFPEAKQTELEAMMLVAYPKATSVPEKASDPITTEFQNPEMVSKLFYSIDKDHNDKLDAAELAALGFSPDEAEDLVERYSTRGDECLTLLEFIKMYSHEYSPEDDA